MLLYICYVCVVLIVRKCGPHDNVNRPLPDGDSDELEPLLSKNTRLETFSDQLRALARGVNPFDLKEWNTKSYLMRFFEIYKVHIFIRERIMPKLV